MTEVYLDYNGSSPMDRRVAEVMVPVLTDHVGNASAIHRFGRRQAALVDDAREDVAALVGGRGSGVVFTAGATEANNLALRGWVEGAPAGRPRILVSAVEHASVDQTARWLKQQGLAKVDVVPVTAGGFVDLDGVGRPTRRRRSAGLGDVGKQRNRCAEPSVSDRGACARRWGFLSLRRHTVGWSAPIRPRVIRCRFGVVERPQDLRARRGRRSDRHPTKPRPCAAGHSRWGT